MNLFETTLAADSVDPKMLIESVLDCLGKLDGRARMLVNRDGQIFVASSLAKSILEEGTFLKVERGFVKAVSDEESGQLSNVLAVNGEDVLAVTISSNSSAENLIVRSGKFDEDLVFLGIVSAQQAEKYVLPDLIALFGLTPSEAVVVNDLYKGQSPQLIAEQHNNSIFTIRAHIRHCYEKIGVSNREELWARLNQYRII